ncbi:hypothetical protein KDK_03620 [Dictyobacter kobayashii]|uniref:Uncharacterized protein n=2 Tax=Dictyobacter kobayashii TaxID=2014872 RepID=A0A402ABT2_9CHLR|nr:hypothetical protein [Dictyobacter kobayashii]GCE16562.1 hypothetical protein KDK_03620 [Dictyobacter kobayashii]
MGKTIQLIAYLLHQREIAAGALKPSLIICPMSTGVSSETGIFVTCSAERL